MSNFNKYVTIFENDEYALYGIIESEKHPAKTLLKIKIDNNIIDIGELNNDNTNREWVEVNDYAIAILKSENNEDNNEIMYIYYIPNNTFTFGKNKIQKFKINF